MSSLEHLVDSDLPFPIAPFIFWSKFSMSLSLNGEVISDAMRVQITNTQPQGIHLAKRGSKVEGIPFKLTARPASYERHETLF